MKFKDLKFTGGTCQLDYNYYILSLKKVKNINLYQCSVFNRVRLPVDLPGLKIEKVENNKWVKIKYNNKGVEEILSKLWAITGIKNPKFLDQNEFYKDIF
tara:strand:+ start:107 stop:406 length:300 start_codon:yes stop_codon:yes gene_type:complete